MHATSNANSVTISGEALHLAEVLDFIARWMASLGLSPTLAASAATTLRGGGVVDMRKIKRMIHSCLKEIVEAENAAEEATSGACAIAEYRRAREEWWKEFYALVAIVELAHLVFRAWIDRKAFADRIAEWDDNDVVEPEGGTPEPL